MGKRQTYQSPAVVPTVRFRVRWLNVILAALVVVLTFALTLTWLNMATEPTETVPDGIPLWPCVTEDSDGCYWDGETMGYGNGHDVVTLPSESSQP